MLALVIVSLPVPGRFHYLIPPDMELEIGHRVLVPFGPRRVVGFVVGFDEEPPPDVEPKVITERLDSEPLVPQRILDLATFTADYYLATPGEVLKAALPPGLTTPSKKTIALTAAGRELLRTQSVRLPSGLKITAKEHELLTNADKRPVKQTAATTKAAKRLLEANLVEARESTQAKDSGEQVALERVMDPKEAWPHLKRARTRQELYEKLADGPRSVEALRAEMGTDAFRRASKAMLDREIVRERTIPRETMHKTGDETAPELTEEQAAALGPIGEAIDAGEGGSFLLFGVTGSGKTEVYLRAIDRARELGQGAIVLVPEIALTPQLEARFVRRFGDDVAVLHSAMTDTERRRRWRRIRDGDAKIALGARSALWAPVPNVGVVVVDEEHESSFKQSSDVRYHARDLALALAKRTTAVAILGSATPSMETLSLVQKERITELRLERRVGDRPMPEIEVVDLAEEKRAMKGAVHLLSRPLQDGLRDVIAKGQQAILFLNRRGFNTIVYCGECGDARRCVRCDVSLTHHRWQRKLACHYCGHLESFEAACKKCGSLEIEPHGAGTERVVETVLEDIPDARVLRLDRDVTAKVGALERTLRAFRNHDADVLVGTQMVAKGHDFPKVTLVGILLADASLAFPDFRAAERTFQLLTQVAGRAGRAEHAGRVVIQTFQPDHYALTCAIAHDVDQFYELESSARAGLGYPPFRRIGLIKIDSSHQRAAEESAERVAEIARAVLRDGDRVVGPAPAPIEKLKDRFRQHVMLFAPTPARLVHLMTQVQRQARDAIRRADLVFDVDPVDLL